MDIYTANLLTDTTAQQEMATATVNNCNSIMLWCNRLVENKAVLQVTDDDCYNYACFILFQRLAKKIHIKTMQTGDRELCMCNWKFNLLLYLCASKYKYRLESFLYILSSCEIYSSIPSCTTD